MCYCIQDPTVKLTGLRKQIKSLLQDTITWQQLIECFIIYKLQLVKCQRCIPTKILPVVVCPDINSPAQSLASVTHPISASGLVLLGGGLAGLGVTAAAGAAPPPPPTPFLVAVLL